MSEVPAKWQGYVVTGVVNKQQLEQDLANCFNETEIQRLDIEPARIFSAVGLTKKTIEVWNQNRTFVRSDQDCMNSNPVNTNEYIRQFSGQSDSFRIAGGYQTNVINLISGGVLISSALGGGELGVPLDELPLYEGESNWNDQDHLDGGLSCNSVLRTVNGVPGPNLEIRSDQGVLVGNHPQLHRVVINVNGDGLNFCPESTEPSIVECLDPSKEFCGPTNPDLVFCPGEPDNKAGFKLVSGSNMDLPILSENILKTKPKQIFMSSVDIYGNCRYSKSKEGWNLIENNAAFNCECQEPKTQGYLGQLRLVSAKPLPVEQPLIVRNPYFIEDLDYWNVIAVSHNVVSDEQSVLFDGLPYLEMYQGTLSQPTIPVENKKYRIQFRCKSTEATKFDVIDMATGNSLITGEILPCDDETINSDFFKFPKTVVRIDFHTSGQFCVTEIGLIEWL